jgi:hypothetical protein
MALSRGCSSKDRIYNKLEMGSLFNIEQGEISRLVRRPAISLTEILRELQRLKARSRARCAADSGPAGGR